MVFFANKCQNVYEKQVILKCFQKQQILRCQNKSFCNDSTIFVFFKVILKRMGASDFGRGKWKNKAKCRKMVIFPVLKQGIFPISKAPKSLKTVFWDKFQIVLSF